ncbi:hypothetical protein MRB53_022028 [Persea americana]|uniref:Uncharacterized protein n=1 Tax=Persea americana TaxID=3435 RepID=A0ACC2L5U1_PERAE|nr:hypothetical protein MRB53_022028 [Persea americana]
MSPRIGLEKEKIGKYGFPPTELAEKWKFLNFPKLGETRPVVFSFSDRAGPATRGGAAVRCSGDSDSSSPATVRSAASCDSFLRCSFSGQKRTQPPPSISNRSETSPSVSGDKSPDPLFLAATQQRDIILPPFPATRSGSGDCVSVDVVSRRGVFGKTRSELQAQIF